MFRYLKKLLNLKTPPPQKLQPAQKEQQNKLLSSDLSRNITTIREILGHSDDIIFHEFMIGHNTAVLIFVQGITNTQIINDHVLKPLMGWQQHMPTTSDNIRNHLLPISQITQVATQNELLTGCLSGSAILLLDDQPQALLLDVRGFETRGINEPATEVAVRGPKEGFNEKIQTNISMLRRKLKNPNLVFKIQTLGVQSATTIAIVYLKGIAKSELVQEVNKRISEVKIDAILDSGYIEQLIEDSPLSFFPTIGNSEKPDIIAANLLEGRVAIFVDGTPFVLSVPKLFIESFQSSEDYYSRPFYASLIRIIRYLSFFITTMAPSIYVALVTFHQELIPTDLIYSMASARESIPFPAVLETIVMGLANEIFREAGLRLPRPVGQAVSIVGALVIGEAAVTAGLISAPLLIVVALTAITSYVVNALTDVTAMLRLLFTIFAGLMGVLGIIFVFLFILIHLCALKSFGVPYLSPLSPIEPKGFLDVFIRAPIQSLVSRPKPLAKNNDK